MSFTQPLSAADYRNVGSNLVHASQPLASRRSVKRSRYSLRFEQNPCTVFRCVDSAHLRQVEASRLENFRTMCAMPRASARSGCVAADI